MCAELRKDRKGGRLQFPKIQVVPTPPTPQNFVEQFTSPANSSFAPLLKRPKPKPR